MNKNYSLLDQEELKKCIKDHTYGKEHYMDPDATSEVLYQDLQQVWNRTEQIVQFTEYRQMEYAEGKFCYNLFDAKKQRYSSDFLGLSIRKLQKAYQAGYASLEELANYLEKTRILGGHILWPVHPIPTINTYRAGAKTYQDRFDLFLEDIKNFYLSRGTKKCICKGFPSFVETRIIETNFFLQYGDGLAGFQNFVHAWKLEPFLYGYHTKKSIKEEEYYQVLCLVHSDLANGKVEIGNQYEENSKIDLQLMQKGNSETVKQNFRKFMSNTEIVIQEREALLKS